ncbi:4-hydroxy-tetrahydrodipicolinate reductase [Psychroflexus sp. YR1-1]|uniref:4-hydroxy-tetrahydrodipicolinate reductase n=1 Tax=Psychroflexus aurantiacus TaxID=2709310 RepID=A0A6B3R7K7_9FLAO|nr:4-hydroxy-tetrahydrodipicolinate reductase [Psychroflexus aurantiacus]NEV93504.1 4-hydroxy-tetrahydrodipicolinate reductase [Psychroflexus aurantiacus]
MKLAILGYGKMGKTVEEIANSRNHEIVYITSDELDIAALKKADVAIDFSIPEAAFTNITSCLENKVAVVSGTTGWLNQYEEAADVCRSESGRFLYASNFSVGVNVFFELNSYLAKMMSALEDYTVNMKEIHHLEKKDAPSGTAISLADQIINESSYQTWNHPPQNDKLSIGIEAERKEGVFGFHDVTYDSAIDTISISHNAKSRKGFAHGAVIAAEWILNQEQGVYSMKDVLQLNTPT